MEYWAAIQKKVYIPGTQILMIEYNIPNVPPHSVQIHLAHAIHINKNGKKETMYTLRCEADQLEFLGDAPYKQFHETKVKDCQYEKKNKAFKESK